VTKLLDGRIELRPREDGSFDELLMYDDKGRCLVHFETMSGTCLWGAFYPKGDRERVVIWINAKGKLRIRAEED
jgi:hypothetical protein